MDDTRVNRYKEYRQSFIKEGAITVGGSDDDSGRDLSTTTSTLPVQEVIGVVQEKDQEEDLLKKSVIRKRIKIIVEISVAVIIIAGLVVLGILAWGK